MLSGSVTTLSLTPNRLRASLSKLEGKGHNPKSIEKLPSPLFSGHRGWQTELPGGGQWGHVNP